MALIETSVELKELNIYPEETFTLWLNKYNKYGEKREAIQVELRVTENGEPEIFTHTNKIALKDFDNWKLLAKNSK